MTKQQRETTQRYVPIVTRARCEGKAACVEACPEKAITLVKSGTTERKISPL